MEKNKSASKDELLEMIRFGADEVIRLDDVEGEDFDITDVLAAGEAKTAELTARLKEAAGKSFSANFTMDGGQGSLYKLDGVDYKDKKKRDGYYLDLGARSRTSTGYNIDQSLREQMRQGPAPVKSGPKIPKHLAMPQFHDFQFFDTKRIEQLVEKKRNAWLSQQTKTEEEKEEEEKEQEEKEPSDGLTDEERAELETLLGHGFKDWQKRDFSQFKNACERYGRDAFSDIARDVGKTPEEIKEYSKVFWSNYKQLANHENIISQIQKGESKIQKRKECMDAVARKIAKHPNPWQTLRIQYGASKGKAFTEEEDRFIVCMTNQLGYGRWEELKCEIRKAWNFRFDWYRR